MGFTVPSIQTGFEGLGSRDHLHPSILSASGGTISPMLYKIARVLPLSSSYCVVYIDFFLCPHTQAEVGRHCFPVGEALSYILQVNVIFNHTVELGVR